MLVRVERSDGTTQLGRVLPVEPRFVVTASPGAFEVAQTYTVLGIEHILTGFDHLLFVLALVILVKGDAAPDRDDHRVHAGAQPDAVRGDAGLDPRSRSAGRGHHRAVDRLRRR